MKATPEQIRILADERLWPRVLDLASGCRVWTGACFSNGYGSISILGKPYRTHRFAWLTTYGPIPDGMLVCHRCDNPPCVNPEHLFLGTSLDNNLDMTAKGRNHFRNVTHCPMGHAYDAENTYVRHDGRRQCRACGRINAAEKRRRRQMQHAPIREKAS